MKRSLLLFMVILASQWLVAAVVTRHEAQQKAEAQLGGDRQLELVLAAPGEQPAYYVFNDRRGQGFAIVAGDDRMGDILGYSNEGCFHPDDMSPAMTEWLERMEHEQVMVREGRAVPRRAPRRAAAVSPMLTTKWGQRWPYNRMAPEYTEGSHCAAGCVAVVMAQVLKYWASQTPTKEIPGYTTEELGLQLDALPATTFNYAIMRDEYDMLEWDEGAQEVARLMRYCGQAAQMDYDVYSGAETSGDYLHRYFGFKPSFTDKYYVEHMSGWEDLIYDELAAGRPVIYSGKKMTGFLKFSGHVYVVDGYDGDGLFHINWGWNGNDDGFFVLTSANDYDIAMLQMAVIGLEPEGNATSIEALLAAARLQDVTSQPLFDLQGRRIMNHQQKKGLRIVDGRLVYIK